MKSLRMGFGANMLYMSYLDFPSGLLTRNYFLPKQKVM